MFLISTTLGLDDEAFQVSQLTARARDFIHANVKQREHKDRVK